MEYYFTNELYHFGVPGMRWGFRKQSVKKTNSRQKTMTKKEYDDKWERTGKDTKLNATLGASIGALSAIPVSKIVYNFSKSNKGRNAAIAALATIGTSTIGMISAGRHTAKEINRNRKPGDSKKRIAVH